MWLSIDFRSQNYFFNFHINSLNFILNTYLSTEWFVRTIQVESGRINKAIFSNIKEMLRMSKIGESTGKNNENRVKTLIGNQKYP
jgi:hypothetical protein